MSVHPASELVGVRRRDSVVSGEQIDLRRDGHHAVIVEVGGGLREYEVRGRRLLDGYGVDEMCSGARGQLLIPWPNRLRDGRYQFGGEEHRVPLSEPEKGNAIHVGATDVTGSPYDFRTSTRIFGTELDTAFTDLRRDERGRAWVRLWRGRGDYGVGLWMDEHYPYYMLFTGDSLPERARRRRSIGVEPMTCAPNAFASGAGLITLAPGQAMTSAWGITPLGAP